MSLSKKMNQEFLLYTSEKLIFREKENVRDFTTFIENYNQRTSHKINGNWLLVRSGCNLNMLLIALSFLNKCFNSHEFNNTA